MSFSFFFIGLLGTIFGSFLNVLIVRGRENMSLWGHSQCMECRKRLRPHHLVPMISWIALRGRCAFCGRPIHAQYPLVEFASAVLWMVAYARHPFFIQTDLWPAFLFEAIIFLFLLGVVVFDLRWKLLPIEPMLVATAGAVVWHGLSGALSWTSLIIGMIVGGLFLGIQVWISHGRAMGAGDPWLGLLMGAFLGWPHIGIALYLTYVGGGLVLLPLWVFGRVHRGMRIPFAPFLAAGTLCTRIFGEQVETWIRFLV